MIVSLDILNVLSFNKFLFSSWYFKYFSFKADFITLFIPISNGCRILVQSGGIKTTLNLCSLIKLSVLGKVWLGALSSISTQFFLTLNYW